jgi:hypothetical protein
MFFLKVEAETFNANNKKVLLYLSLVRPEEDLLDAAGEVRRPDVGVGGGRILGSI